MLSLSLANLRRNSFFNKSMVAELDREARERGGGKHLGVGGGVSGGEGEEGEEKGGKEWARL